MGRPKTHVSQGGLDGVGDEDAATAYLLAVFGERAVDDSIPEVAAPLPLALIHSEIGSAAREFDDEVGWSALDVSWFIEYEGRGEQRSRFTVLGGDFDEERLEEALGEPEGSYWRLGDDGVDLDRRFLVSLGEALAYEDQRVILGDDAPPVEDALAGDSRTLADHQEFMTLATVLDAEGAYGAKLVAGRSFFGLSETLNAVEEGQRGVPPERATQITDDDVLPEPFHAAAVGVGDDDGEPYIVLAYLHADQTAATTNAEALPGLINESSSLAGQPWSEIYSLDEIRTEGTTLVARLHHVEPYPALSAYNFITDPDLLFVHR